MEEGETDNIVHSLQCLCTQQVKCTMYMYIIGTMPLLHTIRILFFRTLLSCGYNSRVGTIQGNIVYTLYIHVHAHVAHCTLNMYIIVPNIELSIHVDHLHTWQ